MSTVDQPPVSKGLLITLGVVLALAAAFGLWTFVVQPLLGEEPAVSDVTAPPGQTSPSPTPSTAPSERPGPAPETFEVFNARDPFQQLVSPPQEATATSGTASATAASPSPAPSASPAPSGSPAPPPEETVDGTTVTLVDVITDASGEQAVQVTVNGTGYTAREGETFAERFKVLDIDGDCATFLFGDSRFTLCKGDTIRK
ncbi:hypothetical protein BH23ACT8_BH23ACT8_08220 [soil metagenome]